MSRQIKGIIFDVGDVFYDATPWRRWLTNQLRQLGVDVNYEQLVQRWESLLVDVYCGRAKYWDRFAQLIEAFEVSGETGVRLADQARQFGKEVVHQHKLFGGVSSTLEALHASGIKLAALSDTESTSERVRQRVDDWGIGQYLDAVVCSIDIGFVKPQRQAYEAAAAALSLDADDCAFVGHDIDELEGATAAGMVAIASDKLSRFDQLLDLVSLNRTAVK